MVRVPKYDELIQPTFEALKQLGGSGNNKEILEYVINIMNLDESIIEVPHKSQYPTYQSELEYRLAWARTYLKKSNVITSSSRAIWSICSAYINVESLNIDEIKRIVKSGHSSNNKNIKNSSSKFDNTSSDELFSENEPWKIKLAEILNDMDPFGFERFCKLVLREAGFEQVENTRPTRDGGVDGRGQLTINGFLAFNVAFQCKRYDGSVSSDEIQKFRGAIDSDEKGIFITTGSFTRDAIEEAKRLNKTIILIDGSKLIDKIIELGIGVKETKAYEIDESFFENYKSNK